MARVAPAELPPIVRSVVPNRVSACSTSQSAAASQSSGAAGHGCSGASRVLDAHHGDPERLGERGAACGPAPEVGPR